jgi:hypothetical protein
VLTVDEYLNILQRKIIEKENVEEVRNQRVRKRKKRKIGGLLMKGLQLIEQNKGHEKNMQRLNL